MTSTGTALEKALSALAEGVPLSRAALQEFSDLDPASLEAVARAFVPPSSNRVLDGLTDYDDLFGLVR
jgi:hypothetical protein